MLLNPSALTPLDVQRFATASLPIATVPLNGNEIVAIEQGGRNVYISLANLLALFVLVRPITPPVTVAEGGTGANGAAGARVGLGVAAVGDLAFHCTAPAGDPTDFIDQVRTLIPGDSVTTTAADQLASADALLNRNIAGGSTGGRVVKDALRFLRNRWTVLAGVLTVYQEDDTTSAWTGAIASDAAAQPIVGSDPT